MKIHRFLFAAMHFMLLFFTSSAVQDSFNDISALLAFKEHVGDPKGLLSSNWTTNTSFCTWYGVSCSHQRQRVVALHLVNISLHGTIAPHITNMSFLSYLSLAYNSLVGPIPGSLSHLPRLKTLLLHGNQLSGSIPSAIFNMSLLTALSLAKNNLSGTLPSNDSSFFSMLPQFKVLICHIISSVDTFHLYYLIANIFVHSSCLPTTSMETYWWSLEI